MKAFAEMNLNPHLVEALRRMNFINATDVQEQVIPIALQGKDLVVRAKTGTGKTGAFLIPIKQLGRPGRDPEALIIVPTRELALQIYDVANKLRFDHGHNVTVVYGGASINIQMQNLRRNPSIVIGTPGRVIDLMERGALRIDRIRFLVLDEADTMLDMGFIDDIEFILSKTPTDKQTLLFSATMPENIINVARRHMHDMTIIKVGKEEEVVVTKIKHLFTVVDNRMKFAALMAYIKQYQPKKAIIFVQTQYAANVVHDELKRQGIDAILIHGGLTQAKREHSMRTFKGGTQFLIATNVAARGIDIAGISDIINFDVPDDPRLYVHRVGRSARMNANGRAFTIATMMQKNTLSDVEYVANIELERIYLDLNPFRNIRIFQRSGHAGYGHNRPDYQGHGSRGYRGHDQGSRQTRSSRHSSYEGRYNR